MQNYNIYLISENVVSYKCCANLCFSVFLNLFFYFDGMFGIVYEDGCHRFKR